MEKINLEKLVKNWLLQAEADFESAKYNLKGKKLDVAAYLCHQSSEKSLKSLYLKQRNELFKTHDLIKLGTLVNAPKEIINACNTLNPIYSEDRYPDFSKIIPAKRFASSDIKTFLSKAKDILIWIKKELK